VSHPCHFPRGRAVRSLSRILFLAALLPLACDNHHDVSGPSPPPQTVIADSLVFTRADSTVLTMGATPLVCCGLYDPSFVNERAMRIVFYDDPANQLPGWQILILIDRAQAGDTTTLPTAVVPPSRVPYVSMFVADIGNDLSSDTEESSGTITVHSFSCSATTIQVDFSVDAVLGSEYAGGPAMRVQGTFRATFPAQSCS
jgi:hypothetical protein